MDGGIVYLRPTAPMKTCLTITIVLIAPSFHSFLLQPMSVKSPLYSRHGAKRQRPGTPRLMCVWLFGVHTIRIRTTPQPHDARSCPGMSCQWQWSWTRWYFLPRTVHEDIRQVFEHTRHCVLLLGMMSHWTEGQQSGNLGSCSLSLSP